MPKKNPSATSDASEAGLREAPHGGNDAPVSLSALREEAAGLRQAQALANLAHVITQPDGSFETWSETLPRLIGLAPSEVVTSTRRWLDLIHPQDRARFRAVALDARAKKSRAQIEYRLWRADGAWVHVRQVMEPIPGKPDPHGRLRWFNTLQDITELVRAQEGVKRLNRVYAVRSRINGAIVRIKDRQQVLEEACRIAIEAGEFVMAWIGLVNRKASLVEPVASAGRIGDFFATAPMAILETKKGGHGLAGRAVRSKAPVISNDVMNDPQRLMRKELRERGINSLAILPLVVEDEAVGILALYASEVGFFDGQEMRLLQELARDVSFALEHIEKARQLDYVSNYDQLTGFPNRALFHERLRLQLPEAEKASQRIALYILDIERFKTINDTLGRRAGDELLAELANRLARGAQPASWFARLGGDHFAIVTPATGNEALLRRHEYRLAQVFGSPFLIAGKELRVSARLGVALFPEDGRDSDTLLRNAEVAVKKAKSSGERLVFYTPEMSASTETLTFENQLREAVEKQQFVLHYQPKVDLATRAIVGLEALIRWQSPQLGLVPPVKFIGLLEQTGLILEVGAWALKQASMDHRRWSAAGLAVPRIAVNVSAIQLRRRDFVKTLEQAIAAAGAPPAVDLEITESVVMEDIHASIATLAEVRRLGVGIAMDDFGTGYSSLAYLARLPLETVKIDRSFIHAMVGDATARTLVETIISMAHALRLKVVAEGVETEEEEAFLRGLRCDQMQGYRFSPPLPAEELKALLRQAGH